MFDPKIMLRQVRGQKLFVSFGVGFSRRMAQLAHYSLIMLSLLAVCIAPTGIKARAKSLEDKKVKFSSLKDNRNRPVKKSLDNKSGKLSKLLLANPQFYVGYEELPEVNITKPFGIDTWIYANTFGTTTDLAVGVVFKVEVSCVGSGTCNSTRMKCDVAGCDGAISMFDNCGENLFEFGMDYCASKSLGDYDPDEICALVYPDAHVLDAGNYYFPHVAGTYLAGGL
jgi:hypothetical protein